MHPCFVLAAQRNPAFWLSPSYVPHAAVGQAVVHTEAHTVVRALTETVEMVTAFAGGGGRYVLVLTALCRLVGVANQAARRRYLRMVALSRGQVERARRWSHAEATKWSHVVHRAPPSLSPSVEPNAFAADARADDLVDAAPIVAEYAALIRSARTAREEECIVACCGGVCAEFRNKNM